MNADENLNAEQENTKMIECENLVKIYKTKDLEVVALQGLDLIVEKGELMAIIGNSGSGKSTLLNIIGGLDRPSAGKIFVDGKDLLKYNEKNLYKYMRDSVGFVWQNNARNLIPYLSAMENVELPMTLKKVKNKKERALELLDLVGLSARRNNKLQQLSGGEQQRAAIAVALANNPQLLLADEPTGNVDSKTADKILDIFRQLNKSMGVTVVIVTHDMQLSRKVDRVVAIRDGRTSSEILRRKSYAEELAELENRTFSGDTAETHDEFAVVDRAGRLQIPRDYLTALNLNNKNKLKVQLEGKTIVLSIPEIDKKAEG